MIIYLKRTNLLEFYDLQITFATFSGTYFTNLIFFRKFWKINARESYYEVARGRSKIFPEPVIAPSPAYSALRVALMKTIVTLSKWITFTNVDHHSWILERVRIIIIR